MAKTDGQIVLGLDIAKTTKQINADIRRLQGRLTQIRAAGALDTDATVRQIDAQIAALQSRLKTIDINAGIDMDSIGQTARQAAADTVKRPADTTSGGRLDEPDTGMHSLDRSGGSLLQSLAEGVKELTSEMSASDIFTKILTAAKQAVSTIRGLDTALAGLRKTAGLSAGELEGLYHGANDTARQMGVTTQSVIEQATAWSGLGFDTAEAAAQMAGASSLFQSISPGLASDDAVSSLAGIMKAYGIEMDDVLDGILSKISVIGKDLALGSADIAVMLRDSASAMAESGNTLEETIALEAAAIKATQDRNAGSDLTTAALRLRGLNEETQALDDSLRTIRSDLYDLTGVSIMEDADTYKSTYQILKEMSAVWDSLTETARSDALGLMFGETGSHTGDAVLKNFSAAEQAMDDMAASAGSAGAEMAAAMDSIDHKLNKVKETGTGIAQNLFAREDIKSLLDIINSLGSGLDWLTEKLGLLGTIGAGAGLFAGIKNTGKRRMSVRTA